MSDQVEKAEKERDALADAVYDLLCAIDGDADCNGKFYDERLAVVDLVRSYRMKRDLESVIWDITPPQYDS